MKTTTTEIQISNFIREIRHKQGMNTEQLAAMSGIAQSQINRIENGNSAITIPTLIGLCHGLNLSPNDLLGEFLGLTILPRREYSHFIGESFPLDEHYLRSDNFILGIHDIEAFLDYYHNEYPGAKDFLQQSLSLLVTKKFNLSDEQSIYRKTAELLHTATRTTHEEFSPIPYPIEIPPDTVSNIYSSGGVIMLQDAGAYVKGLRQKEKLSIDELQHGISISRSALGRMELGQIERTRLAEISELDQKLHADGMIISLFWAASEYQFGYIRNTFYGEKIPDFPLGWYSERKAVSDVLLTIDRWLRVYSPEELNQLAKMRATNNFYYSGLPTIVPSYLVEETSKKSYPSLRILDLILPFIAKLNLKVNWTPPPEAEIPETTRLVWEVIQKKCAADKTNAAWKCTSNLMIHPHEDYYQAEFRSFIKSAIAEDKEFADGLITIFLKHQ